MRSRRERSTILSAGTKKNGTTSNTSRSFGSATSATTAVMSVVVDRSTPTQARRPLSALSDGTAALQASHVSICSQRLSCSVQMFRCSRLKVF